MGRRRTQLKLEVLPQPDDSTCGPTCLHAVYRYFEREGSLEDVIREVPPLPGGGTLAVSLANHALKNGFGAQIYTYNLQLFDPTWFERRVDLQQSLRRQRRVKRDAKLGLATDAYLEFLKRGGDIYFEELDGRLLRRFLSREIPVLTGLSATYLYACSREYRDQEDDIRGEPAGHFVVLSGYDRAKRLVTVADPLQDNPRYRKQYYEVKMDRLIGAILLGIVTYDANLLVLTPREGQRSREHGRPHRRR